MRLNIDRLQQLLSAQRMSYQQLSDITNISKATLHRYFVGKTEKIPIERLWPIAYALNTTPQYLMGDTDDPSPVYIYCSKPDDIWHKLQNRCLISSEFNELINIIADIRDDQIHPVTVFVHMLVNK